MRTMLLLAIFSAPLVFPGMASADEMSDTAQACLQAAKDGDQAAFEAYASRIVAWRSVFNTAAQVAGAECLSVGYGEPWEYHWPSGRFMASVDVAAKAASDDAKKAASLAAEAQAEAELERLAAEDRANAARVGMMVYVSCSVLLERDQVAAMTNELCVETFLTNGLPASTNP